MSATPVRFRQDHATVRPRVSPAAREDHTHADRNELPFPTIPAIANAIRTAAGGLNRYSVRIDVLERELAEQSGLADGSVLVGPGSLAMLHAITGACCAPGDALLYAWRSFDAFQFLGPVAGARSIEVALTADGGHDLPAMAAAIDESTRLVIVCSPNNPNGVIVGHDDFVDFLASVPPHVMVLLDAAYGEFTTAPSAVDGLALLREERYPNLAVLKTFSKAYGLAGLRLGALYGAPALIAAIRRLGLMTGVSELAVAAGLAALDAGVQSEVATRVSTVVAERERMVDELVALGYTVADVQTNFVYVPSIGVDSERFRDFAAEHGVGVRAFDSEGVRVSVIDADANDCFLAVAREWAQLTTAVTA